jgi:hypothetical protein
MSIYLPPPTIHPIPSPIQHHNPPSTNQTVESEQVSEQHPIYIPTIRHATFKLHWQRNIAKPERHRFPDLAPFMISKTTVGYQEMILSAMIKWPLCSLSLERV